MKICRPVGFVLMVLFAATGLLFLFIPEQVLSFFNNISITFNMPQSPVTGLSFFLILAVGYMYTITLLAFLIYRHPDNKYFPQILAHAKIASSILSLALFVFDDQYLIYLTNFVVDGIIGGIAIWMYTRVRRAY